MVCKLLKALYGLKQAPKKWHEKFDKTLIFFSIVVNEADKCVYYRYGGGEGVILCLYVDDILIFGTGLDVIKEVKDFLSNNFEMKDLGEADVILNIKLLREGNGGLHWCNPIMWKMFLLVVGLVAANLLLRLMVPIKEKSENSKRYISELIILDLLLFYFIP